MCQFLHLQLYHILSGQLLWLHPVQPAPDPVQPAPDLHSAVPDLLSAVHNILHWRSSLHHLYYKLHSVLPVHRLLPAQHKPDLLLPDLLLPALHRLLPAPDLHNHSDSGDIQSQA